MANGSFLPKDQIINSDTLQDLNFRSGFLCHPLSEPHHYHHRSLRLPTPILSGSPTVNQPTRPIVLSFGMHPLSGASPSGLPGLVRNIYLAYLPHVLARYLE
jgi:hypothetical protein